MRQKRLLELISALCLGLVLALLIPCAVYLSDYRNRLPPLMALAQRVGPTPDPLTILRRGGPAVVSPDGAWALRWEVGGGGSACVARSRRGAQTVRRSLGTREFWASGSNNKLWMPDSRSWVGLTASGTSLYAVVQGLDTSGIRSRTALGFPRGTVASYDLMPSTLLGFTGPHRVLARPDQDGYPRGGKPREVLFYEFDVGPGPAHLRQYAVTLPEGRDGPEAALSPDGQQLAWLLADTPESPGSPGLPISVQLAVSRRDGSEMKVLALLRRKEFGEAQHAPKQLHWSADGKQILFSFRGFEWSFPVYSFPARAGGCGCRSVRTARWQTHDEEHEAAECGVSTGLQRVRERCGFGRRS